MAGDGTGNKSKELAWWATRLQRRKEAQGDPQRFTAPGPPPLRRKERRSTRGPPVLIEWAGWRGERTSTKQRHSGRLRLSLAALEKKGPRDVRPKAAIGGQRTESLSGRLLGGAVRFGAGRPLR